MFIFTIFVQVSLANDGNDKRDADIAAVEKYPSIIGYPYRHLSSLETWQKIPQ